jgi:hypothetical protein
MGTDLQKEIQRFTLSDLALPVKTLFTGYLLAIGLGLIVAGGQIMLTHGMADGKFGLSVDDLVYSYYGDRTGSTIEGKLNGSMKDMAPPPVRMDIIKWVRAGAPEAEWEPHFKEVFATNCVPCHSNMPNIPNFADLQQVKKVTKVNEGASIQTLTRVSHIHLFGISFIFFFVGWIFTYATGVSPITKAILISTPFVFLIVDVAAWWMTKLHPNFAWFVIIGGFGYSLAATIMIFTSLYQMWVLPIRTLKAKK